jgi:pyridinium-3,5-bisthiocarboxylic acid mononucleotide nickel chelatase
MKTLYVSYQGPPGITGELVTPTAAALLATLTQQPPPTTTTSMRNTVSQDTDGGSNTNTAFRLQGRPPAFTIRHIGIGAGTKDFHRHPNILRLWLGDSIVA